MLRMLTILKTHHHTVLSQFSEKCLLNLPRKLVSHFSVLNQLLILHKVAILLNLLYRVVFHLSLAILLKIKMETYPKVRIIHKVLCLILRIKQVPKISQFSSKHRSQILPNNNSIPISKTLTRHNWINLVVMEISLTYRTLSSDPCQEWVLKLFDLW